MTGRRPGAIASLAFRNVGLPGLGLEVFDYADLRRRATHATLVQVHRPQFHQLMLVTRGSGTAMVDFVEHRCAPGSLLHVAPGQVQVLPYVRRGVPATLDALTVIFEPEFPQVIEPVAELLGPAGHVVARRVRRVDRPGLTGSWNDLHHEYDRARRMQDLSSLTVALLRQLLGTVLLRIAAVPGAVGSDRGRPAGYADLMARFVRDVDRSFASTRNVAAYAQRLGCTTRTLARACDAVAGRSPKTIIDDRVTLEAKRLLAHADLSVAAIGRQLGFADPTNFGKYFVARAANTPGDFRRQHTP